MTNAPQTIGVVIGFIRGALLIVAVRNSVQRAKSSPKARRSFKLDEREYEKAL